MTNPTLFLDFDGVLHPDAVYRRPGRGIELEREGHNLFEWNGVLISALEPHPNVQIILSTSWVRVLSFTEAKKRLPGALQTRVVGATWHSQMDEVEWQFLPRFFQITRTVYNRKLTHWLAVDDDDGEWPDSSRSRLVLTDSELGLGATAAQKDLAEKLALLVDSARRK